MVCAARRQEILSIVKYLGKSLETDHCTIFYKNGRTAVKRNTSLAAVEWPGRRYEENKSFCNCWPLGKYKVNR